MTLHLYFARKFVGTFLALLAGFAAFVWLIELLEHIRRFDSETVGFGRLALMAALHMPQILYEILTLVVLLATVAVFIGLSRTSELVVTRATGRSAIQSLVAPVVAALVLGGLTVALVNPLVAAIGKRYEREENRVRGEERVISISREGLWLRQGGAESQAAIRAERADAAGTRLYDVTFIGFRRGGGPSFRIEARTARLGQGEWELTHVKRWDLTGTANPEADATRSDRATVPTDLTADQIRDSFSDPAAIPIWGLPAFIAQLETAGFSSRAHRVWLQSELARPLAFAAMVLVGAVFTLRHTRFGRTGLMVLLAVLSGFLVYFVADLSAVMGQNGQIPILVAVWIPPAAAICLALAMLLHTEDG